MISIFFFFRSCFRTFDRVDVLVFVVSLLSLSSSKSIDDCNLSIISFSNFFTSQSSLCCISFVSNTTSQQIVSRLIFSRFLIDSKQSNHTRDVVIVFASWKVIWRIVVCFLNSTNAQNASDAMISRAIASATLLRSWYKLEREFVSSWKIVTR